MTFAEREPTETLVEHLLRNATPLALSSDQKTRLRHAYRLQLGTRRERGQAGQIAVEVRREIEADVGRTLEVEIAHGGKVSKFNDAGAKVLSSRDGLLSLFRAGRLDGHLTGAGLAYRSARENEGRMRSQLGEVSGSGDCDLVGHGLVVAKLAVMASKVDREVALLLRTRPDALHTLRCVAGDGQTLRSLAAGGKQFEHLLGGLTQALGIAARHAVIDPS